MASTTVSAILRSNQAYYQQLCDKVTLDWGIGYLATRYPRLGELNQFRECVFENSGVIPDAYDAVTGLFSEHGLTCGRWAPAADQPIDGLDEFLTSRRFARRDFSAMVVERWVDIRPCKDVRILPARAMRKGAASVLAERCAASDAGLCEESIAAALARLDDGNMDAFVAVGDGVPLGYCALFQVGDIGRIVDLFVVETARRRGTAVALLDHVLKMARRLALRITCAEVPTNDEAATALCLQCGMKADGTTTEFVRSTGESADK